MKKLILLLLFIPLVSFGQDVNVNEYYDNGQKITEKTWQDGDQSKTLVEIVNGDVLTTTPVQVPKGPTIKSQID